MKPKTVLMVEDEPLLGVLMSEVLREEDLEVMILPDAKSALHYLFSGAHADILFTDIELGAGMDGVTLALIVHEIWPDLPIVYASGSRTIDHFSRVPGATFLPKPYSFKQVAATLARLIEQASPMSMPRPVRAAHAYG